MDCRRARPRARCGACCARCTRRLARRNETGPRRSNSRAGDAARSDAARRRIKRRVGASARSFGRGRGADRRAHRPQRSVDEPPVELVAQQQEAHEGLQPDGRDGHEPQLLEMEAGLLRHPDRDRHEHREANRRAQHRGSRVAEPLEHARAREHDALRDEGPRDRAQERRADLTSRRSRA